MFDRLLLKSNQKVCLLDPTKDKDFPHRPQLKKSPTFVTSWHDVTKVGDFYKRGLWGNFSFFVGSNWNRVPGYIKNVDRTACKFQFEITSNKKVIAKKPLTNLYEMNNNFSRTPFCIATYTGSMANQMTSENLSNRRSFDFSCENIYIIQYHTKICNSDISPSMPNCV